MKAMSIPRRGSTLLHPSYIDHILETQTDSYPTPPQNIRGGSASKEKGEEGRIERTKPRREKNRGEH